jgi:hypothetical protein
VAIVLYMDGVLRNQKKVAIPAGLKLFRILQETQSVIIIGEDKKATDQWLRENKLGKIDNIVDKDVPAPLDNWQFRAADYIRSQGPVDYVITADIDLATELLNAGFRVMLFLDPIYLDHKFRPDSREGRKSWNDIKAELDRQNDLLLEDKRVQ